MSLANVEINIRKTIKKTQKEHTHAQRGTMQIKLTFNKNAKETSSRGKGKQKNSKRYFLNPKNNTKELEI